MCKARQGIHIVWYFLSQHLSMSLCSLTVRGVASALSQTRDQRVVRAVSRGYLSAPDSTSQNNVLKKVCNIFSGKNFRFFEASGILNRLDKTFPSLLLRTWRYTKLHVSCWALAPLLGRAGPRYKKSPVREWLPLRREWVAVGVDVVPVKHPKVLSRNETLILHPRAEVCSIRPLPAGHRARQRYSFCPEYPIVHSCAFSRPYTIFISYLVHWFCRLPCHAVEFSARLSLYGFPPTG